MATVGHEQVVDVRLSTEETKAALELLADRAVADSEHPFGSKDRAVLESIEAKLGAALELKAPIQVPGLATETAARAVGWAYCAERGVESVDVRYTGPDGTASEHHLAGLYTTLEEALAAAENASDSYGWEIELWEIGRPGGYVEDVCSTEMWTASRRSEIKWAEGWSPAGKAASPA
jgi:hypothetical protein